MTAPRYEQSPLLLRLMAEMGAGKVYEGRIVDPTGGITEGYCDGGVIYVDPSYGVVKILLHEALHRMLTDLTESAVEHRTEELMGELTQDQVHAIYDEYKRRRRTRKKPVIAEHD